MVLKNYEKSVFKGNYLDLLIFYLYFKIDIIIYKNYKVIDFIFNMKGIREIFLIEYDHRNYIEPLLKKDFDIYLKK